MHSANFSRTYPVKFMDRRNTRKSERASTKHLENKIHLLWIFKVSFSVSRFKMTWSFESGQDKFYFHDLFPLTDTMYDFSTFSAFLKILWGLKYHSRRDKDSITDSWCTLISRVSITTLGKKNVSFSFNQSLSGEHFNQQCLRQTGWE